MGVLKNHWLVLQRSFLIILALQAIPAAATAATYYVSLQGNNADAGTEAKPWRTIQHAVDSLKPGDTAIVGAGVYRERIEVKRGGTAKAPISLIAAPGARVIVSGADLLSDGWTKEKASEGMYRVSLPRVACLLILLGVFAGTCMAADVDTFPVSYEIRADGVVAKATMTQDGSMQVLDNKLDIRIGPVLANGKDYGQFSRNDFILLDGDGQLFVNGKKRHAAEP